MKFLGILMLDTRFPRLPGDIGHPDSFGLLGIPARHHIVAGANPERVVRRQDPALLAPFIAAEQALVAAGATMISTSCGFLAAHQQALADAVAVPVLTSSLLACRRLPQPGILTIDARALDRSVLDAAGVPPGTPIAGVAPDGEFQRAILGNLPTIDAAAARADVIAAARALQARAPGIRSLVLECTNMSPYRDALADALGLPVHDIMTELVAAWR